MTGFNTQAVRNVTGWLALVLVSAGVVQIFRPFLVPLGWAAVLSVFFYPLSRRVFGLVRRPNLAALVTVVLITLLLVVPVILLTPVLIGQTVTFLSSITNGDYLARTRALAEHLWERSPVPLGDIQAVIDDLVRKSGSVIAQQSARLAGNLVMLLFDLVVMLLAMFYLLRDGERMIKLLRNIAPWGLERNDIMIREAAELVEVTITSGFVTAAVQGMIGGLVFWLLGIQAPLFWGALMGFLAFLPVVGPWLVWAPAAARLLLTGETTRGVILVVVGFLIVSGADNVLRPVLIAGRSQLNGLLVFISLIGGISAMGLLGAILGPVLMATAVGLLRGYHETVAAERLEERPQPG